MLREFLRIPFLDLPIYSFGLMLVLGCWLAIGLAKLLSRRCGLNPEHFVNIGIIALLAGVVGARASHVLENWNQYFGQAGEGLGAAINIRSGGLTYYGGVILATPFCMWYAFRHGIPIRRGMDIIAPALMIGLGIGRVGCFLNGCCWGATCDAPWAVTFPYESPVYESHVDEGRVASRPAELFLANPADPSRGHWATDADLRRNARLAAIAEPLRSSAVHPTQLYSTATALLIAALLVAYFTLGPAPGRVFALMMLLEGIGRFTIETLRIEPAVAHVGAYALSYSMVIGILLAIAGPIAWIAFGLASSRRSNPDRAMPALA